jgi:RNA polymerase sigma-70 factor (subfamily 1)
LLEAHQGAAQLRGQTEGERKGWLRQILARNLANAVRDYRRDKRDVARESPLPAAIEQSSARLESWLVAEQSTPSQRVDRQEQALRLADALADLPEAQREAVILRHWQGSSLAEVSRQLGRSPAAVAGLLHRGLKELRARLLEADSE